MTKTKEVELPELTQEEASFIPQVKRMVSLTRTDDFSEDFENWFLLDDNQLEDTTPNKVTDFVRRFTKDDLDSYNHSRVRNLLIACLIGYTVKPEQRYVFPMPNTNYKCSSQEFLMVMKNKKALRPVILFPDDDFSEPFSETVNAVIYTEKQIDENKDLLNPYMQWKTPLDKFLEKVN